jgi:hypothetical protein
MAVIAGMVGAGALGYEVVLGSSRSEEWGKGAAAGDGDRAARHTPWTGSRGGPPDQAPEGTR